MLTCIYLCRTLLFFAPYADFSGKKYAFGGYITDKSIREQSTSGGAFSAIVETWCDNDYVVFGAEAKGLNVEHGFITEKNELDKFRKSKYSQSKMGNSYREAKRFLKEGKKVVFSGTPCQIAGLRSCLDNIDQEKLLTIEVICEGVPTPHYIRRFSEYIEKKHGAPIDSIDYRYKDCNRWDFEVMLVNMASKSQRSRSFKYDRWFNPFWSIWLNHLMSRPSCYKCVFTNRLRVADITLGDLWGVHIYCPELYGENRGASLIIGNTQKGKDAIHKAETLLYGHEIPFEQALKYQGPMKKSIVMNPHRSEFMHDVISLDYYELNKKWAPKPSIKLLFQKYIWGNRQKVFIWNLKNKFFS